MFSIYIVENKKNPTGVGLGACVRDVRIDGRGFIWKSKVVKKLIKYAKDLYQQVKKHVIGSIIIGILWRIILSFCSFIIDRIRESFRPEQVECSEYETLRNNTCYPTVRECDHHELGEKKGVQRWDTGSNDYWSCLACLKKNECDNKL